ncbi:Multidrug efflux SMR transporter [Candidatus Cyrtobacter comes]|uniref:Guanidinium exporter n=1 Tax=Candidatus Cyrtobacter comes TaxID=675776 RepID=A0ABU5L9D4_9RICK|nr:multidrug efflux SMR transporter [Candidatus Cyrtobacter comes]MDZ5762738.1 Multidrug efflux SMR transporter [Candidatus Cyrtobacter comes]
MESWFYLIIAGFSEVAFAICLKLSEQFTKIVYTILFIVFAIISFFFMSKAMRDLPISIVYAVWTGIGISGTTVFEIIMSGELNPMRILLIIVLMFCILGLKVT